VVNNLLLFERFDRNTDFAVSSLEEADEQELAGAFRALADELDQRNSQRRRRA